MSPIIQNKGSFRRIIELLLGLDCDGAPFLDQNDPPEFMDGVEVLCLATWPCILKSILW